MYVRRNNGLLVPAKNNAALTAEAADRQRQLAAERDLVAVQRQDEAARRATEAQHHITLADIAERAITAKRARRERARDIKDAESLGRLYRKATRSGARAKVRADIQGSAEMRALRIAAVRTVSLIAGLPVLLAFAAWSTTGVQEGATRLLNLEHGSPSWVTAWGIEPALIAVVALIIIGRAVLRSSGGDTDWRADAVEWTALGASLALNIVGGWDGKGVDGFLTALPHTIGPIGCAGTAFLIGLFDTYVSRAKPWDDAPRLTDLGLVGVRHDASAGAPGGAPGAAGQPGLAQPYDAVADALAPVTLGVIDAPADAVAAHDEAPGDANPDAPRTRRLARPATQPGAPRSGAPKVRAKSASKPATSGDAADADPATQAALLYLSRSDMSYRKAADAVGGTSEASVRRRVSQLEEANKAVTAEAALTQPATRVTDVPMTPISEPKPSVDAGVNGSAYNPEGN